MLSRAFAILLTAVLTLFLNLSAWGQTLRLGTAVHPPYQVKSEAGVQGSVVNTVKCVLNNMAVPFEIAIYPWKRNFNYLKADKLDLIFSLQGNSYLDQYGVLTSPLAVEKWYWYGVSDLQNISASDKVGVVSGSSQEAWLHDRHYTSVTSVNSLASLVRMAKYERVRAILVDEQAMLRYASSSSFELSLLQKSFYRFSIFAAYVSKRYLEKHTGFVERFNEGVFNCSPPSVALSERDRAAILQIQGEIESWLSNPALIAAVVESNRNHMNLKPSDIQALDQRWRKPLGSADRALISSVMAHPVSSYLKQIKQAGDGLFTEIILIDNQGLNVGLSDVTSDYWQGDEEKFQRTFIDKAKQPHIGALIYDESSRSFQSQISLLIRDSENSEPIGVITVGVDIGKALSYTSPDN
ncbi:MAG: transporter substrate-binding domain-containing protein [Pseudomonadales bacterium]|nr:transporter substrate-binding domain-containing protein [Pseudomonadales bacterium]